MNTQFTDQQKLAELEKEIAYRWAVFGRLVRSGKMKQTEMDFRIGVMQAIRDEIRNRVQGRLL